MKIAVFGYYNSLNAGDDRIQYCITRLLQGNTVVFLPHYLPPPREYLETFDWILIGGGGLVFERVGVWANVHQWLKHCKAKIGFIGLGVNHVPEELEIELSQLVEAAEFFYVRDSQSKALLHQHPKVEVYPDLTWCFPLISDRKENQEQGIALNLLPCHWKEFNYDAWVESLKNTAIYPFPFHFGRNRDFDLLSHYFGETTPSEFSLEPLAKSKLLIGCRYHAITFSMQIGKLFIGINYDEKVKRLLQESDLLDCCLETTDYDRLQERIQFVLANEAKLRQKINAFATLQIEQAANLREAVHRHLACQQTQAPVSFTSSLKAVVKRYVRS